MKHIDALCEFIDSTLNTNEKAYLISKLSGLGVEVSVLLPDTSIENTSACIESDTYLNTEFITLNKRVVKASIIKRKVLIQKPKTLEKLKNLIKQIAQGDGGFSGVVVSSIIDLLVRDKLFTIDENEELGWLK